MGGAETTAGLYWYCCKQFHFISFLARLIRNSLRAIYKEAMVLYIIKHSHNNLTADIYRGNLVHRSDMSLAPAVRAQKKQLRPHAGAPVTLLLLTVRALLMDAVTASHI
jgi:hypothetical protein